MGLYGTLHINPEGAVLHANLKLAGAAKFDTTRFTASRGLYARCIETRGVIYRVSRDLGDYLPSGEGVDFGDLLVIREQDGDWLHTEKGWWLPLTVNNMPAFKIMDKLSA